MIRKCKEEIYHNTKIKHYPQGDCKYTVASRKIFKEQGWELAKEKKYFKISKPQDKNAVTRDDSKRRSKVSVEDIIRMNEKSFKYFVTLTINPEIIDSKDPKEVARIVKTFLKNMVSRYGLQYVFVPEYHKSGAIHLHGLTNDVLPLVDSGTRKVKGYEKPLKIETIKRKGIALEDTQMVYNIPQWKYGFSTAYEIYGDLNGVCAYVTKYITKDLAKIFGNFYYAGGDVVRKVPTILSDMDYASFPADKEYFCEAGNISFKYLRTD